MRKKKNNISNIFIPRRHLTLGVKLVATFAMTYYSIYFVMLTIFGFYFRSVYDPTYSGDPLWKSMIMSVILWAIVGVIVFSLIQLFRRKRYGKFLFMTFTIILVVFQIITSDNQIWISYVLEILMALIIAPLRVFIMINQKIQDEIVKKEEV